MQQPPPPPNQPARWTPPQDAPGAPPPPPPGVVSPPPAALDTPIWQPGQPTGAAASGIGPLDHTAVEPAPSRGRRTALIAVIGLVAAAALGGGAFAILSNDDSATSSGFSLQPALAAAGDASKDASFDATTKAVVDGQQVQVNRIGLIDADAKVVDVTVTSRTAGAAPTAPVNIVLNAAERIAYIRATTFPNGEALAAGKTWIEVDKAVVQGRDISTQFTNAAKNPLEVLAVLAKGSPTEVGTLTIGTEELKHFTVEVPTKDVETLNPDLPATVEKSGGTLPSTVVFDLFVTKDNRLRRIESDVDIGPSTISSTVVLSDVTTPISLTAPDQANSVKLSALSVGLGASGGG